ncbi:MAG TPA: preprotein translocase subunit YajC [Acidimicrobiales bacterium]|nr:preprotein translocase subunit YajC [Acidimicrobiales bacterium]
MFFIYLLVVFVFGWLLLVRPQQQRARRQRELIATLEVGAEVQTAGGIIGRIVGLDDEVVRIEVAPGVVISFVRGAIARVVEVTDTDTTGGAGDAPTDDPHPEAEAG